MLNIKLTFKKYKLQKGQIKKLRRSLYMSVAQFCVVIVCRN